MVSTFGLKLLPEFGVLCSIVNEKRQRRIASLLRYPTLCTSFVTNSRLTNPQMFEGNRDLEHIIRTHAFALTLHVRREI